MTLVAEAAPAQQLPPNIAPVFEPGFEGADFAGNWSENAPCTDPTAFDDGYNFFFPIGTGRPDMERVAEAKAICADCPVALACARIALDFGPEDGIWGGMTNTELRALTPTQRRLLRLRVSAEMPTIPVLSQAGDGRSSVKKTNRQQAKSAPAAVVTQSALVSVF